MSEERPRARPSAPLCRWRTSAETFDLVEAVERIEALLNLVSEQLRAITSPPDRVSNGDKDQP
jgi:hypothetical protein